MVTAAHGDAGRTGESTEHHAVKPVCNDQPRRGKLLHFLPNLHFPALLRDLLAGIHIRIAEGNALRPQHFFQILPFLHRKGTLLVTAQAQEDAFPPLLFRAKGVHRGRKHDVRGQQHPRVGVQRRHDVVGLLFPCHHGQLFPSVVDLRGGFSLCVSVFAGKVANCLWENDIPVSGKSGNLTAVEIFLVPPLISQMPAAELGNEAVLRHPFPDPLPVPVIVLVGQLNDPLFLPAAGSEKRLLRQNDRKNLAGRSSLHKR